MSLKGQRVVVVGGSGFLGTHLTEALLRKGCSVAVVDIRAGSVPGVEYVVGDLADERVLGKAFDHAQIVFNVSSPPPELNDRKIFYKVNVEGMKHIVACCKKFGVHKLVLTSTASVVYDGTDLKNADETFPYAAKPMDYYTETKILQEKIVREANQPDGSDYLLTVAIRPHGIFGPRDSTVRVMVQKARSLQLMIGDGKNVVDFTYVANVVHGHVLAAEKLSKAVGGKAFFITNDEPLPFWDFIGMVLEGMGHSRPRFHIPFWLALFLATVVDMLLGLLSPIVTVRSAFTPQRIKLVGTYHYYNPGLAKRELGYKPIVSVKDGLKETLDFLGVSKQPAASH